MLDQENICLSVEKNKENIKVLRLRLCKHLHFNLMIFNTMLMLIWIRKVLIHIQGEKTQH